MTNPAFKFTKDYLDCIAKAWMYSVKVNSQIIHADDLVLWVFSYTSAFDFHKLFWKFLWLEHTDCLQKFSEEHYWSDKPVQYWTKLKLELSWHVSKQFAWFKKDGITKFNFLVLLHTAFGSLSPAMEYILSEVWFDLHKAKEKLMKIIKITHNVEISPIEFFKTLHSMVDGLKLDVDQMDMFVDLWTITWNDLESTADDLMKWSAILDNPNDISNGEEGITKTNTKVSHQDKKLTIEYFGNDITNEAKNNELDPVIGREKEIDQIIYTLLRKTKNNPMLIGEAGVGKTAIVEWLAHRIVAGSVPEKLKNKRIMMVDIGSLVAWTKYRWEFEARLKAIIDEATDPMNNIIMFIDEIHTIIGAWNSEWWADAANMLKPLLARWKMQLIWATTHDEYQKHIEKDPALKRRFQELHVDEPSQQVALEIMHGIKSKFEDFHGVVISDEAIEKSITYSVRYIMNKHLPDKAIDIIDEACARVSTLQAKLEVNNDYLKVQWRIEQLQQKIEKAIEKQDYFKAAEHKEKEEILKKKLKTMRQQNALPKHLRPIISVHDVWQVLADKMWLPLSQISDSEVKKLATLQEHLQTLVLWQDEAVQQVVQSIQRNRLSAVERSRPIWSFLFLWASWVGKTFIAKLLAKEYFGDEKALIRVDMSEFMERHSVSKLIGSAPWYVWYDEWWLLTEQVKRKPYSVILFDEIEKASPDVLNVLLQIMDEGHLKDNKWRWIDFKNTIIILTSNIGSEEFGKKQVSIWFSDADGAWYHQSQFDQIKDRVLTRVKDFLQPELINRLTAQIVFKPLSKEQLWIILHNNIKEFYTHWRGKYKWLTLPRFTKKKIAQVIDKIYDPAYWARPIQRYIENELEPELINQVIQKEIDQQE